MENPRLTDKVGLVRARQVYDEAYNDVAPFEFATPDEQLFQLVSDGGDQLPVLLSAHALHEQDLRLIAVHPGLEHLP
jgi:hypothetical protein